MKEAKYYKPLKRGSVQCVLCPHFCTIKPGASGFCGARKNIGGKLFALDFANPSGLSVDPIEKKPLYHFLPGSKSFSVGSFGCNLGCLNCQNWRISRSKPAEGKQVSPKQLVGLAIKNDCKSVSYTYNEPFVFIEYVLETAKLARKKGLKNILVTNGFVNEKPLKDACTLIDAANVDIKSFSNSFYKNVCSARLEPVLDALKIFRQKKIWIELTNLIIPALNDNMAEIREMCLWIKNNIGADVPLHFSAFYPAYKMQGKPSTPQATLEKARDTAVKAGLNYVYLGNIQADSGTYCHNCKKLLVARHLFSADNKIKDGKCPYCKTVISGIWK